MEKDAPNILMVMVDSLRPDHTGFWGRTPSPTPNIDLLASRGAFFANHFCPMPSSSPSRASIFTGKFPHSHGLTVNDIPLPETEVTMPEILQEMGYNTVACPGLDPGLEKGFEEVLPLDGTSALEKTGGAGELIYSTSLITQSTLRWLRSEKTRSPWFLWLDYGSPHEPWKPPQEFASKFDTGYTGPMPSNLHMYEPGMTDHQVAHLQSLYDGEIAFVDDQLGLIFKLLERKSSSAQTLIVVLSDHGVFLGEHGLFKKPPFLLDPLMRSTLVMSWPGVIRKVGRVEALTHICDVMPTMLDLLGAEIPENREGKSLLPLLRDPGKAVHEAVFMEFCTYKGTTVRATRTARYKYIHHRRVGDIEWGSDYSPQFVYDKLGFEKDMLFDLRTDPRESRNIAHDDLSALNRMKSYLIDWLIDTGQGTRS